MKRNYLKTPGQSIKISLSGNSGAGKTALIEDLQSHFMNSGLVVSGASGEPSHVGYVESFVISCPTLEQSRQTYLASLDDHQRETLRAHLSSLGYEL